VKVSREQFTEHRQRILEAAGRLFREKGFEGIGVDGIMQEAGLTHGGFYGHFGSKADLADQACAAALGRTTHKWEAMVSGRPEAGLAEIAKSYLSKRHRDDPGSGCVFAALGGEVARRSDAVRTTVTQGVRAQLGILEKAAGGRSQAERREQAVAALSGLVGAMVVARLVDDPALSDEILTVAAGAVGGAPRGRQGRSHAGRPQDGADHGRQ
jgi:TetR/AcrR family transcriptional regulator, transcriptional repressor for nem operon